MAYVGNIPVQSRFNGVNVISGNTSAVSTFYYVCTASLTLALPAAPTPGDYIGVANMSSSTTVTINRGGNNIMKLAENMVIDALNVSIVLMYVDATNGWIII